MLEGYNTDGSFRYRDEGYNKGGAYTSHAHGWSTGPTDALVSYVVGLRPTSPGGQEWVLDPQFGDLSSAQGGFLNPLGTFSAAWELVNDTAYQITVDTPSQTSGIISLPMLPNGKQPSVFQLDDASGQNITTDMTSSSPEGLVSLKISGGNHRIFVS
jgi:hypothetical protein